MSDSAPVPQLQMIWPTERLIQPPSISLSSGYRLQTYRPGDESAYFKLMTEAGWPGWDKEKLKPWLYRVVPNGWFTVVHEETDQIVASAMALHDHTWQRPFCGELGWVATAPDHRQRGLATAATAAVTARLIAIGYPAIHLFTEHYRLAALSIYLRMGYLPLLYRSEMPEMWQRVCAKLKRPFTPERWPLQPPLPA